MKVLVSEAVPLVRVAVMVTSTLPLVGRVTRPLSEITSGLLLLQVMADSLAPVLGSVRVMA